MNFKRGTKTWNFKTKISKFSELEEIIEALVLDHSLGFVPHNL